MYNERTRAVMAGFQSLGEENAEELKEVLSRLSIRKRGIPSSGSYRRVE